MLLRKVIVREKEQLPSLRSHRVAAIDQFPAQEFNIGLNGLPANDLTLLERAQNEQEVQRILSRLSELKSISSNSGKTDRELLMQIVPRWVQSPSEIENFTEQYYNRAQAAGLFKQNQESVPDLSDKSVDSSSASSDSVAS